MNTDTTNATTKTFTVEVCETFYPVYEYTIQANSKEEALEMARYGKASTYTKLRDNDYGDKEVWDDTLVEVA